MLFWDILEWTQLVELILICKRSFLKIWYKNKKITLQDICLSKQEETNLSHEEVFIGKLVVAPIDTSNEESTTKLEEERTEARDEMAQERHENEEDTIEALEEIP